MRMVVVMAGKSVNAEILRRLPVVRDTSVFEHDGVVNIARKCA